MNYDQKQMHDAALEMLGSNKVSEGFRQLKMLAESGFHHSQHSLAYCYETGLGVAKDEGEAFRLYALAADQGNAASQTNIGEWCLRGHLVGCDPLQAWRFFKMAGRQGFGLALHNMAVMLDHGVGVNEDGDQSLQLYKLAVGAGYMQSANNVGIYYLNGKHVVPDAVLAEEWLTRGKQSGDEIAAKNLMKLKELQSSRAVGSSSSDFRKYAKIWLESPFLF